MFPEFNFDQEDTISIDKQMGKVFLFDFSTRQHVLRDGKLVEASYEEAVKQWVTMLLITELDKYKIYEATDFGISLRHFIGRRDLPAGVIVSEVKRQLEEKVLMHPEILGVVDFTIDRKGDTATITFSIETRKGIVDGIESEVKYSG